MSNLTPDSDSEERISLEQDLALSGQDADSFYEEEMRNMRRDSDIDRLSHRMTLLFILIPCFLCAIFAFAYLDIRNRLDQLDTSGSKKVEALSEDLIEKVTSLSEKYEVLEQSLGQRLSILKDVSITVQDNLKKNEARLEALANTTIDKKGFEEADKARSLEFATSLAALKKEIAKQQAAMDGLSETLRKELDREANAITAFQSDLREQSERFADTINAVEALQKKVLKLDLGLKLLSEETIDKKTWERAEGKGQQLEKKVNDLAEELAWLENKLNVIPEKKPTKDAGESQRKGEQVDGPPTNVTVPESGKIIEQEIKD